MADERPEVYELVLMPWQRDTLLEHLDGDQRTWARPVAQQIRNQIPIPAPTKIGAVVRTDHPNFDVPVFIRWAYDSRTHSPWVSANDHETPYRTDEIGRILDVPFEGVDL